MSAAGTAETVVEALAALAYPANAPRRDSGHECEVGHVVCDYGSGGYECASAYVMTTDDGAVGSE